MKKLIFNLLVFVSIGGFQIMISEQTISNQTTIPEEINLERAIQIQYTNWRGETAVRNIVPIELYWGKTDWHPVSQWLLKVWDVDRGAYREYAFKDIKATL